MSGVRVRAELTLVGIALIWGSTFVVVKSALSDASTLVFLAIRFSFASLLLFLVFRSRLAAAPPGRASWFGGAVCGAFLFVGYALQTAGLRYTSASNSASNWVVRRPCPSARFHPFEEERTTSGVGSVRPCAVGNSAHDRTWDRLLEPGRLADNWLRRRLLGAHRGRGPLVRKAELRMAYALSSGWRRDPLAHDVRVDGDAVPGLDATVGGCSRRDGGPGDGPVVFPLHVGAETHHPHPGGAAVCSGTGLCRSGRLGLRGRTLDRSFAFRRRADPLFNRTGRTQTSSTDRKKPDHERSGLIRISELGVSEQRAGPQMTSPLGRPSCLSAFASFCVCALA